MVRLARCGLLALLCLAVPFGARAQDGGADKPRPTDTTERVSPWLLLPVVSSNPKLGTTGGVLGAFLHSFDPESRVSIFGAMYQYTSTHSQVAAAFARTSFDKDHQRLSAALALGYIKNNYDDYLGTGQPLQTNDDLQAVIARYLYRVHGPWFLGAQGTAANYQVLGETTEDELVLETLGVQPISAAALGAVVMHDSRDSQDMPTRGWYLNMNNLAYREGFGGSSSFDAYRADIRAYWSHGRHVLAGRQLNWFSVNAPLIAQSTVVLRGYKLGQYLAPNMSSLELEERLSLHPRWGLTVFGGAAALYGRDADAPQQERDIYPMFGTGLHFVIKPVQRMLVNFEYAQGVEDNRGVYLKFGYGW